MSSLNIPLLQFALFKSLCSNEDLKIKHVEVNSTIVPRSNFFVGIYANPTYYVEYIQSSYKVSISENYMIDSYYFFFRNKRNLNGGFITPSSLEVIHGGDDSPLIKIYYPFVDFPTEEVMKNFIVDFCKDFVQKFVTELKNRGVL